MIFSYSVTTLYMSWDIIVMCIQIILFKAFIWFELHVFPKKFFFLYPMIGHKYIQLYLLS